MTKSIDKYYTTFYFSQINILYIHSAISYVEHLISIKKIHVHTLSITKDFRYILVRQKSNYCNYNDNFDFIIWKRSEYIFGKLFGHSILNAFKKYFYSSTYTILSWFSFHELFYKYHKMYPRPVPMCVIYIYYSIRLFECNTKIVSRRIENK